MWTPQSIASPPLIPSKQRRPKPSATGTKPSATGLRTRSPVPHVDSSIIASPHVFFQNKDAQSRVPRVCVLAAPCLMWTPNQLHPLMYSFKTKTPKAECHGSAYSQPRASRGLLNRLHPRMYFPNKDAQSRVPRVCVLAAPCLTWTPNQLHPLMHSFKTAVPHAPGAMALEHRRLTLTIQQLH